MRRSTRPWRSAKRGAVALEAGLAVGVEHGLGQRQDDEGGSQHANKGQPPRRLGRRLLAIVDADEDARRRKLDAARARRDSAKQPVDDRQQRQRTEQRRVEEGEAAEAHG
jgi:hypothetical protein